MDVLEVGCGTGQITGWLVDQVRPGRVVGIDFSPAMLARARGRGVDAEFRPMDICGDESVAERFDVVLCFHSFPHFRDPAAALRQITGRLKPGGQLLVMHLTGSTKLNAFHHRVGGPVGHDRLPPALEWPQLLRPAGLQLVEAVDHDDLFLVVACAAGA
jgi:ubiquinone/menaquinone biosynthesis C-methylase UbiE